MRLGSKIVFVALSLVAFASCSRHNYLVTESYDATHVPPKPDYSNPKYWAALPNRKDLADTTPGPQYKDVQDTARADVFFVYPTTYTYEPHAGNFKWNADVNDVYLNQRTDASTILYQASVFNGACKIYAPRYRQAHLSVFFTRDMHAKTEAMNLAYSDVEDAFRYYLKWYNNGRPFIIASHSQGTIHAAHLIQCVIEPDSALRARMITAYLVGMPVPADSFKTLKPCGEGGETGCFCTWNTFASGYYPPWYKEGLVNALATNPLTWTTDTTLAPSSANVGGLLRDFHKPVPGLCDAQVHHGMVWIHKPNVALAKFTDIRNYHIADYNLFYLNIRENVQRRVKAYLLLQELMDPKTKY